MSHIIHLGEWGKFAVTSEQLEEREKARERARIEVLKAAGARPIAGPRDTIWREVAKRISDRLPIPSTVLLMTHVEPVATFLNRWRTDYDPAPAAVAGLMWFRPNNVAEVAGSLLAEAQRLDLVVLELPR